MTYLASLLMGLLPLTALVSATPMATELTYESTSAGNDFTCKSTTHPNPVVLLHGLGASNQSDLNSLEDWLRGKEFCTFSLTYGSYAPEYPYGGGFKHIAESAQEIAAFIRQVQSRTGASKIDLVGHSEGGFQALYVPKFEGLGPIIDQIVPIAPATHGTTLSGLYELSYLGGSYSRDEIKQFLDTVGCGACSDSTPDGAAVMRLNDGNPIVQPGNTVTVIITRYDEIVTPTSTSIVNEPGVNNFYVQDICPLDPVGHIGLAKDRNVWNLVLNSLEKSVGRSFPCTIGLPAR